MNRSSNFIHLIPASLVASGVSHDADAGPLFSRKHAESSGSMVPPDRGEKGLRGDVLIMAVLAVAPE